jgi:lipoprotein-anchoring transpeptidase ErfK/SrfK
MTVRTTGPTVSALAVAFLAMSLATSAPARADVVWVDDRPVFRSDTHRRERQVEQPRFDPRFEQRDERRMPVAMSVRPSYPRFATGGARPEIAPEAPPIVPLARPETPGTVIIDQSERELLYVLSSTSAYRYPISVGRDGFRWSGDKRISAVRDWPDWTPPAEMRQRQPWLPVTMTGGIDNPLGAKALYLGSTLYRIHGTNDPKSIGRASSSGCFRMMNKHVLHLASLVDVGTLVRVMRHYPG